MIFATAWALLNRRNKAIFNEVLVPPDRVLEEVHRNFLPDASMADSPVPELGEGFRRGGEAN